MTVPFKSLNCVTDVSVTILCESAWFTILSKTASYAIPLAALGDWRLCNLAVSHKI